MKTREKCCEALKMKQQQQQQQQSMTITKFYSMCIEWKENVQEEEELLEEFSSVVLSEPKQNQTQKQQKNELSLFILVEYCVE